MDTDFTKASVQDALQPTLERDLSGVLNRYSQENTSNTPDFILAQYLLSCLAAWNTATQQRETWYGRDARPTLAECSSLPSPPSSVPPDEE